MTVADDAEPCTEWLNRLLMILLLSLVVRVRLPDFTTLKIPLLGFFDENPGSLQSPNSVWHPAPQ
jgi:hypothetical protein